jgi:p-aminobenzoyl-glutamate transporter AbgT
LTILSFVFLILIVIIEGLFIFHNIAYIINDNQPIIIFDDILYTIWFLVFASSILITIVQTFYISSFIRTRLASVDKSSNDNQTILA